MTVEQLERISKLYSKNIPVFGILDSRKLTKDLVLCRKCNYTKIHSKSQALVTEEDKAKHKVQTRRKEVECYVNEFLRVLRDRVKPELFDEIAKKVERVAVKYGQGEFTSAELAQWNKFSKTVKGISDPINWTTLINENTDKHTIYHELMHQITTTVEKQGYGKKIYCGFEYQDVKFGATEPTIVGRALNEGMTELMVQDYFGTEHTYAFEKNICRILGLIVGEENLKEFYLTNDMEGLSKSCLHHLKSEDPQMFMNFVRAVDFIYNNQKASTLLKSNKRYVLDETCKEIGVFLSRMFINSLLEETKKLRDEGYTQESIYTMQQQRISKFTKMMQTKHAGLSLDISGTIHLLNQDKNVLLSR